MENQTKNLKSFIVLWMSGLVLCLVILGLSLILSTNTLQSMTSRILIDSRAIESAHQLEKSVLSERREDLLWRATHDSRHLAERQKKIDESDGYFRAIPVNITSGEERKLYHEIDGTFKVYRKMVLSDSISTVEDISMVTDNLFHAIERYRNQNRNQMTGTLLASEKLDSLVDRWSIILIVGVSLIVLAGSLILNRRIFQPLFGLARTVDKFGEGDFTARARIYRNDELGVLSSTFNTMAVNINDLMKDRFNFIATVAHDLKNPLVTIGAAAYRIKKKVQVSANDLMWLDRIIENIEYIETMLNDLMDSVQIESGNLKLQLSDLELVSFVRDIQRSQNELTATHSICFEGESECWIKGDSRRLRRAILNLISNAVKYSPEQTTITLKVLRIESTVFLKVEDRGIGIDQDEMQNLFIPYRRLSRTRDTAPGTGLGLFSVKMIIDRHGGSIHITSNPGEGTTVEIALPVFCAEGAEQRKV